jgi:hypothetical protein
MRKYLLAISFAFITCAFITHGVLAYQFNMVQTLSAEEESHEEGAQKTGKKADSKEKYFNNTSLRFQSLQALILAAAKENNKYSKGFADKPYLPPKFG